MAKINPNFPLYIPSKGRYEKRPTSDYLSYMGISHTIVVEEQEYENYKRFTHKNELVKVIILDKIFQKEYQTLDNLGNTRTKGSGPARNFIWDHAKKIGSVWHWIMDDNIISFLRANRNRQIMVNNGAIFRAMEDFCLRYENLYMAGPNYYMFFPRKKKVPPFIMNTRIYSCNLIRNDIPFQWRGRYNEDTILSIDILKAGYCTVLFNAFLQKKLTTLQMRGGNTDELYAGDGIYRKSKLLVDTYPQYTRLTYRFGRVHHYVNYGLFKGNGLIRKRDINWDNLRQNEYGMKIIKK